MERTTISEVGTINVEQLEIAEGAIEMRIPVEVISEQMDAKLDRLFEDYCKNNPHVNSKDVYYEARLVFQFGRANPEFSLMLIVFDEENEDKAEIWDELQVTLSEEQKKYFKKLAWEKLGESLFNI